MHHSACIRAHTMFPGAAQLAYFAIYISPPSCGIPDEFELFQCRGHSKVSSDLVMGGGHGGGDGTQAGTKRGPVVNGFLLLL